MYDSIKIGTIKKTLMKHNVFLPLLYSVLIAGTQSYASVDYHDGNVNGYNFTDSSYDSDDFSYSNFSGVSAEATTFSSLSIKRNYSESNFSSANLKEALFDYAYLTNVNFANANLYDAYFISAVLSGADFSGANVQRVDFTNTTQSGFTANQLYSTATYAQGNLQYMSFQSNTMTDWKFSGKDLTRTDFSLASLVNSDFRNATLTNSIFYYSDLSGVDFRGSTGLSYGSSTTTNTVLADGSIAGGSLNLSGSASSFIVRPSDTAAISVTASGSVADGASLVYRDISDSAQNAKIVVSGAGVELNLSQANIDIYFMEDYAPLDSTFITLAESTDGATIVISGLGNSNIRLFNYDGSQFEGSWKLSASEDLVGVSISIPESSMWSVFPLLATICAFILYRMYGAFPNSKQ